MQKDLMPDVAAEKLTKLHLDIPLKWVGMSNIEMPVMVADSRVPALVNCYVDLVKDDRGIHMSRMYQILEKDFANKALNPALLMAVAKDFLKSHEGISKNALFEVSFDYWVQRKALVSENTGWRKYPVKWSVQGSADNLQFFSEFEAVYSSTCPASASLAREVNRQAFELEFAAKDLSFDEITAWVSKKGLAATPHAQRSIAKVKVCLADGKASLELQNDLIDKVEEALQTPVQTVVKREDEQEFARRNGANLMFCEDAGRRIGFALKNLGYVIHHSGEVRHQESLHPHDAVARF